jgi:hypothetical protein
MPPGCFGVRKSVFEGQILRGCAHLHGMVANMHDEAFRVGIAPVAKFVAGRVRGPVTAKERLFTAESEITALIYQKWKDCVSEGGTETPDAVANQLAYAHAREATRLTRRSLTPICAGGCDE